MSKTEVLQILQELKNDCSERRTCIGCKYCPTNYCILSGEPNDWQLEQMRKESDTECPK